MICQGQQASSGAEIRNKFSRAYVISKNKVKVNLKLQNRITKKWENTGFIYLGIGSSCFWKVWNKSKKHRIQEYSDWTAG